MKKINNGFVYFPRKNSDIVKKIVLGTRNPTPLSHFPIVGVIMMSLTSQQNGIPIPIAEYVSGCLNIRNTIHFL